MSTDKPPERAPERVDPPVENTPPPPVVMTADDNRVAMLDRKEPKELDKLLNPEPGQSRFPTFKLDSFKGVDPYNLNGGEGDGKKHKVPGTDGRPPRMPYADEPPDGKDVKPPKPPILPKADDILPPGDGKDAKPRGPGDGKDTTPKDKPDTTPGAKGAIERDPSSGKLKQIDYPKEKPTDVQKSRTFEWNGNDIKSITTTDKSGTRKLFNDGKGWKMEIDGMSLDMPGNVKVDNQTGDVSFQTDKDGVWRVQKADGSTTAEKSTLSGARVQYDKDAGKDITSIKRNDGSTVSAKYENGQMNQFTESKPGQDKPTVWNKDKDGTWKSDGQPPQERKDIKLEANGNTTIENKDGTKTIVRGSGTELQEGPGKAKFHFNDQGQIKQIDYPDGKKVRGFEFDKNNELNQVTINNKDKNETLIYNKDPNSDKWTATKPDGTKVGEWTGKIKLGEDGTYSLLGTGQNAPKDGKWTSYRPDGSELKETIADNGARSAHDKDGNLRTVIRPDNSKIDSNVGTDGKINQISETDKGGNKVTWTKGPDGNWKSDSPKQPEQRKNMTFNEKGEIQYDGENGKFTVKNDGTKELLKKDRSRLEYNQDGTVGKVTAPNGDTRNIEYGPDGKPSKITDTTKKDGSTKVWDAKDPNAEKRNDLFVDKKTGDISWENPDKSASILKSNFSRVDLNANGKQTKVTAANGNTREFTYNKEGALDGWKDTRKGAKGDKVEIFARNGGTNDHPNFRQVDGDGKPVTSKDGKERTREDVQVRSDGDLEHKGADGKIKTMRAPGRDGGEGFNGDNVDVESARDNFLESLRGQLDEPRMKRMEEMMKSFEDRMADRTAERKLAKVKTDEEIDAHHQKTVAETYNKMAEMVASDDPKAVYDKATRAKLAENFMYHAQDPRTVDQGPEDGREGKGHGTCWISSAAIWGLTQHPGAMADYMSQIALKGEYTTKNSGTPGNPLVGEKGDNTQQRTVKFSRNYLSFSGLQENEWSISTATDQWKETKNMKRQCDGDRSPVSRIFDCTLPLLGGSRAEGQIDGGTYESFYTTGNRPYIGNKDLMYMVTGDTPADRSYSDHSKGHLIDNNLTKTMLEKGSVLSYSPGHLKSQTIRKMPDGTYGYFQDNQHGELDDKQIGVITDLAAWARGDKSAYKDISPKAVDYKTFKIPGEGDFGTVKAQGSDDRSVRPQPQPRRYYYR